MSRGEEICYVVIIFIIFMILLYWLPIIEIIILVSIFCWQTYEWKNIISPFFALMFEAELINLT